MLDRGVFISFDGPDGGGKTTQIERLRARLADAGRDIIKTRELGGTPEAEKIRDLVVRKAGGDWLPLSFLMLAMTARYEHTETLIKPALAEGKIVLSDRYADSTYVYQVMGQGADPKAFETVYRLLLGDFRPDLTFILDLDPDISTLRARTDIQISLFEHRAAEKADDRFEAAAHEAKCQVRAAYLTIAQENPDRCVVIDAAQDVDKVADDVWTVVKTKLGITCG